MGRYTTSSSSCQVPCPSHLPDRISAACMTHAVCQLIHKCNKGPSRLLSARNIVSTSQGYRAETTCCACLVVPGASLSQEWSASSYLLAFLTNDIHLTRRQYCMHLFGHAHKACNQRSAGHQNCLSFHALQSSWPDSLLVKDQLLCPGQISSAKLHALC